VGNGELRIADKTKDGIFAVIWSCYLMAKRHRFAHTQTDMLEVCSALVSAWHSLSCGFLALMGFVPLLRDVLKG